MEKTTPDKSKIAEICDRLWVSGKIPAINLDMLKQRNITVVITMYDEKEMIKHESHGIEYYQFPIRDNCDETIGDKLWEVPRFIKAKLDEGKSVLVHCKEVLCLSQRASPERRP